MRYVRELSAGFVVIGLGLAAAPNQASASPVPSFAVNAPAPLVQKVDYWRRYYRRHGYPPVVVVPAPIPVADALPALTPPVVMVIPVRQASCGEYHYWDGERCLDARYNKPYLGPR
jgi:hypothetical protein